ncbi:MAG: hypothetical protein DHS20C02_08890 [Micavibrio sp.]|nr:MAG: hypothetical protein DHS20C02_08890 [Micavibrio sp.]
MSELSIFSDEEITLLTSLPYKVGVWISHADDEEGEADDEREMKSLSACLKAVAKEYDGPGLVDDIARETLKREPFWMEWTDQSYNILPDCEQALVLLKEKAGLQDAKNYKSALLEIAATVAQAYGEFNGFDEVPEEEGFFGSIVNKVVGGFSGMSKDDANHPMNISPSEDSAISQLAAALKIDE